MTRIYSETEVVARVGGLTVARLRAFVAADCVAPVEQEGRLAFAEADLARLQLLEELVEDFDLDEDAAAVVVSLVDQIHGLRRELRRLGEAVAAEHPEVRARDSGIASSRASGSRSVREEVVRNPNAGTAGDREEARPGLEGAALGGRLARGGRGFRSRRRHR